MKFLSLTIIPLFPAELQCIRFYLLSLVLFIVCHKSYDLRNSSLFMRSAEIFYFISLNRLPKPEIVERADV